MIDDQDKDSRRVVFDTVEQLIRNTLPPELQTDAARKVLEQLTKLITQDATTGIPNKRAMDDTLEKTLAIAKSYHVEKERRRDAPRKVTFIMIDLDGFKGVNDNLAIGHAGGDAALRYFADFMKKHLRPTDSVARMGGDEFGVLMEADETAAKEIMGRLRKQMAVDPFEYNGVTPPLSFSFGAHEITAQDANIETIKADADSKAYADKAGKHGRLDGFARRVAASRKPGGISPAP